MIEAKHSKWAHLLFDVYVTKLLKYNFNRFIVLNDLPKFSKGNGLVLAPNHFTWWDGFFTYFIYKKFFKQRKFYVMMMEQQLKKYWFF